MTKQARDLQPGDVFLLLGEWHRVSGLPTTKPCVCTVPAGAVTLYLRPSLQLDVRVRVELPVPELARESSPQPKRLTA